MEEPEKTAFDAFKKPLGRTAYGTIDYTKTRMNNPQIILPSESEENIGTS